MVEWMDCDEGCPLNQSCQQDQRPHLVTLVVSRLVGLCNVLSMYLTLGLSRASHSLKVHALQSGKSGGGYQHRKTQNGREFTTREQRQMICNQRKMVRQSLPK